MFDQEVDTVRSNKEPPSSSVLHCSMPHFPFVDKLFSSVRGKCGVRKMEKTGCEIICGAPTTLAIKGQMR